MFKYLKFLSVCSLSQCRDKISLNKINIVGGKSASLGEMYNNLSKSGINVPWGFGITTNAYSYFIKHNNLHNKINDLLSILNTNK